MEAPAAEAPATDIELVVAPASDAPAAAAPTPEEPEDSAPAAAAERIGAKRVRPPDSSPVDELQLPASAVARIVKARMPDDLQLGRDARSGFSRAASIFILYVTATANDLCREAKRSTITASDVVAALDELEFDTLSPAVSAYLQAYRAGQEKKKAQAQDGQAPAAEAAADEAPAAEMDAEPHAAEPEIPVATAEMERPVAAGAD